MYVFVSFDTWSRSVRAANSHISSDNIFDAKNWRKSPTWTSVESKAGLSDILNISGFNVLGLPATVNVYILVLQGYFVSFPLK